MTTDVLGWLAHQKATATNAGNHSRERSLQDRLTQVLKWLRNLNSFESRRILLGTVETVVGRLAERIGAEMQQIKAVPVRSVLRLVSCRVSLFPVCPARR